MTKTVLLVYAVDKNTGLSAKVGKIHDGFVAEGCRLEKIYVEDVPGFAQKIINVLVASRRLIGLRKTSFDVIYIRYLYYFFPIYLLCVLLKKPYQIEINNKNKESLLSGGQRIRAALDAMVAGFAIRNAKCVHVVTTELVDHYHALYPGARIVYTSNFVVDEQYRSGERVVPDDGRINLLFMGDTEQDWHGMPMFIEQVIAGNAWFSANCRLHIVGRCSSRIDALIAQHRLADSVITHGFLSGKGKHEIVSEMDIGIGCFNLPLIGLKEAAAIKTGEYLYSGLHLVLGAPDSRLSPDLPFVLYVDLLQKGSHAQEQIREFATRFRDRRNRRAEAHEYAAAHLLVDKYVHNILREQCREADPEVPST